MVDNEAICLGSCIDMQDIARSRGFESDIEKYVFDDLSIKSGKSVVHLRGACLRHQLEVIDEQLRLDPINPENEELEKLRKKVQLRITEMESCN